MRPLKWLSFLSVGLTMMSSAGAAPRPVTSGAAQQQREYSLEDLRKMLAEVPPDPIICATGIRWFTMSGDGPHPAKTVRALEALFNETKQPRNRKLVLHALSLENDGGLRSFWHKHLNNRATPADWVPTVVRGVVATGTDADIKGVAARLGTSREIDLSLLDALQRRPTSSVRPQILGRFQDRTASDHVRVYALRALLKLPQDRDKLIEAALADKSTAVRREAAGALVAKPSTNLGLLRPLLKDLDPTVRQLAVQEFGRRAGDEELPTLLAVLADPEPAVRRAAEDVLLTPPAPPAKANPFEASGPVRNTRLEQALAASNQPESVVNRSAAVLGGLARWKAELAEFAEAIALYRRAVAAAERHPQPERYNADYGATARFELAYLLALQGSREEALVEARKLAGSTQKGNVLVRDYPLGGSNNQEIRAAGETLVHDLVSKPLHLRVTPLLVRDGEDVVRLRIVLENAGDTSQRLLLHRAADRQMLPSNSISIVTGLRGWHSARVDLSGETEIRVLHPGDRLEAVIETHKLPLPVLSNRVDVQFNVELLNEKAERKPVLLRGIAAFKAPAG
jgi:tetratricopeptide (TPR) repeat protein